MALPPSGVRVGGGGAKLFECAQILADAQALLAGDGPRVSVETIKRVHIFHVAVGAPLWALLCLLDDLLELDVTSTDHRFCLILYGEGG